MSSSLPVTGTTTVAPLPFEWMPEEMAFSSSSSLPSSLSAGVAGVGAASRGMSYNEGRPSVRGRGGKRRKGTDLDEKTAQEAERDDRKVEDEDVPHALHVRLKDGDFHRLREGVRKEELDLELLADGGVEVGGEVLDEDVLEEGVGDGETDSATEGTGEAGRGGRREEGGGKRERRKGKSAPTQWMLREKSCNVLASSSGYRAIL
jgi:hypothetical protein